MVPIMVDCTSATAPQKELMSKYGVTGYPTVIFTDPMGEKVETLGGRDASAVAAQIQSVTKKHAKATFLEVELKEAFEAAREADKLVAVLFVEEGAKAKLRNDAIAEYLVMNPNLQELRKKFVWVKRPLKDGKKKTEEADAVKARKNGTIVFLLPAKGIEDLSERVLEVNTNPKSLEKDMEKAFKEIEKREKEKSESK